MTIKKKKAFELTNGDKNQQVESNTELDQCISVSIWSWNWHHIIIDPKSQQK